MYIKNVFRRLNDDTESIEYYTGKTYIHHGTKYAIYSNNLKDAKTYKSVTYAGKALIRLSNETGNWNKLEIGFTNVDGK